jgi:hypothetical protein
MATTHKEDAMRFGNITSILFLSIIMTFAACGGDGGSTAEPADAAGTKDTGGEQDVAKTDTSTPRFNYIPLNEEACVIEEAPSIMVGQSKQVLTDLITKSDSYVDAELEVCTEKAVSEWSFDCTSLGGKCESDGCSVAWKTPEEGEIILTEVFDAGYEEIGGAKNWIELSNVSEHALDLTGCYVQARSPCSVGQKFTIAGSGPVVVAAGETFLIADTENPDDNGGITPDFLESEDVSFGSKIGRAYNMSCNDTIIDQVDWSEWSVTAGVALQLSADKTDATSNDDKASWCDATAEYGSEGYKGTPGAANEACP